MKLSIDDISGDITDKSSNPGKMKTGEKISDSVILDYDFQRISPHLNCYIGRLGNNYIFLKTDGSLLTCDGECVFDSISVIDDETQLYTEEKYSSTVTLKNSDNFYSYTINTSGNIQKKDSIHSLFDQIMYGNKI